MATRCNQFIWYTFIQVQNFDSLQRDLQKLRLESARSYVKLITDGNGPVSYTKDASIQLTASVQGLGPLFKIMMKFQNTGKRSLLHVPVCLHVLGILSQDFVVLVPQH